MPAASPRSYLWSWADIDIPHSAGQVRQLPSPDIGILRDQEEECERLAGTLYTKGLICADGLRGKTSMDKKSYLRQVPRIDLDKDLFPDE